MLIQKRKWEERLTKSKKAPIAKKALPIMGTIHDTPSLLVHPNQNKLIGIQNAPTKAGGNLFSGFNSPFALNCRSCTKYKYAQNGGRTLSAPTRMPTNERPSKPSEKS